MSLVLLPLLLIGCGSSTPSGYQGKQGFRIAPPKDWVERARDDLLPPRAGQKILELPMPKLTPPAEKMLVRYDRLTSGRLAWLRVSEFESVPTTPLKEWASARSPGAGWKSVGVVEQIEVGGQPAVRVGFKGRWNDQDYANETVAVAQDNRMYLLTASFPAGDEAGREEARASIAGASWPKDK